jgi:FtsZ-interacting cell division protein ZipA
MSTVLVVVIVVLAALALLVLGFVMARKERARRELKRERLSEQVGGHRQEAEAHGSRVEELSSEMQAKRTEASEQEDLAERHARLAEEHRGRAGELAEESEQTAEQVSRQDELARKHREKADDLEEKL